MRSAPRGYNWCLSSTVLILRIGGEPDDTWASELEGIGYCVLYAEEPAQAHVHLRFSEVDFVLVDTVGEEVSANAGIHDFVAELSEKPGAPPLVLVSGDTSPLSYSIKFGQEAASPMPCESGDRGHMVRQMSAQVSRSTSTQARL